MLGTSPGNCDLARCAPATDGIHQSAHSRICIAQVIGSFGGGGAQRLAYNLASALAQQGVRSLAVAVRSAGSYAESPPENLSVVTLGADRQNLAAIVRGAFRLRKLIHTEEITHLHVHGSSSLPFVVLALAGMKRKPKLAFTWQDSENVLAEPGWRRKEMAWALRCCDSVSGSSRSVAQRLLKGARLSAVGVFHGGVPITPASLRDDAAVPWIVWLARFVPPKDPQILVRAAARLKAEGLQFVVHLVGKAPSNASAYWEETRRLVDDLSVQDVLKMPGFVPDEQLSRLLRSAHIGVQTSHTEGLSIALMEQMMAGLAMVATDVGDTSVALGNGQYGLLIPPQNEEALTDALRQLLLAPELRRRIGTAARERALSEFSLQAMAGRAMEAYVAARVQHG